MKTKLLILTLTLLQLFMFEATAQDYPDSKGKDFWLAYMPNFHNNRWNNTLNRSDSLYIFITSDRPTSGRITYTNKYNQTLNTAFNIADITKIYTFKVSWFDYEIMGFNDNGIIDTGKVEVPVRQTFHIETDEDVTVYAHSQANMTSDAFLVLPTDALGNDYFIMTYKSDGSGSFGYVDDGSTPSEFVIVATEDSTLVNIIPSSETYKNGLNKQVFLLRKGEAYLVQSRINSRDFNRDLTGSEVHSDKPVAVFAGHQRSNLPIQSEATSPSRDFLCEQMPPIRSWGKNAILVPYPQPSPISSRDNDIYRILAAYDDTEILLNDQPLTILNRGEYYEGDLIQPGWVKASAPILVAQFKKTSQQSDPSYLSDPFMMIIPQVEQFGNFYRFINLQAYEYRTMNGRFEKVYEEQYVTIVAPNSTIPTVKFDGQPVAPSLFRQIPSVDYSYAWIKSTDGTHTVSAEENIGIYIYGYGVANSYGYFGGMNFKKLDYQPPQITGIESCYEIKGTVYDTTANDTKIKNVMSPPASQVNVAVSIEQFEPLKSSVNFRANLIDKYNDGAFTITAMDSAELLSRKDFSIAGFTIQTDEFPTGNLTTVDELKRIGTEYCVPITFRNYGKFSHIFRYGFKNDSGQYRIDVPNPLTLTTKQVLTVNLCFKSNDEGIFTDTLYIFDECGNRSIAAFRFTVMGDNSDPQYELQADRCNRLFRIKFVDSLITDSGIQSVTVLSSVNCDVAQQSFVGRETEYTVTIIDPAYDAYFKIKATDNSGHETVIEKTIPGFTLSFPEFQENPPLLIYKDMSIGSLGCKKIKLYNYGSYDIIFDGISLKSNIHFSLPPSQFPITVRSKDSSFVEICFKPTAAEKNELDTLIVSVNCLEKGILLEGIGEAIERATSTRCGVPVTIETKSVAATYFLEDLFPNPADNIINVRFGSSGEDATFSVFDIFGNRIDCFEFKNLSKGVHEFTYNLSDFESGLYYFQLSSKEISFTKKISVIK